MSRKYNGKLTRQRSDGKASNTRSSRTPSRSNSANNDFSSDSNKYRPSRRRVKSSWIGSLLRSMSCTSVETVSRQDTEQTIPVSRQVSCSVAYEIVTCFWNFIIILYCL